MAATKKNMAIAAAKAEKGTDEVSMPSRFDNDFDVVAMPFAFQSEFRKNVRLKRAELYAREDVSDIKEEVTATNQLVWFATFKVAID